MRYNMFDMKRFLEKQGFVSVKQLKNGEWIGISRMLYTWGLCVGLDKFGYKKRYCYERLSDAVGAVLLYEGEGDPDGPWIKVKGEEGGDRLGPGLKEG
jgi:hypothetical protein